MILKKGMIEPEVSVIVPVYNVERYFEQCLRSLFGQTLENMEYLFVNDCTPDGSMALLDRVLEDYPARKGQVRILEHAVNRGLGAARDTGLRAARGRYIIHCDSDDWVERDMYESMCRQAVRDEADIVCCDYFEERDGGTTLSTYPYERETRESFIRSLVARSFKQCVWNKLVRRDLYTLNDCWPFEGVNMSEDLGLTVRLLYHSRKTVILRRPLYHYNQQNPASLTAVKKRSHVEENILCARLIDGFFRSLPDPAYEDFRLAVNGIKFMSKVPLLTSVEVRDIVRWKTLFAESHGYLWKFVAISPAFRLAYWLALHGCAGIVCRSIDFRKRMFRLSERR